MPLELDKLRAADVLLYRGNGVLAHLIRFFDRSEVNHAGLYLGAGMVGEALGSGLERRPIAESIHDSERVLARRLTAAVESMDPVIARAEEWLSLHNRYAFEQIVLLALLSLSRRVKGAPILKRLVRKILDEAAAAVTALVSGGARRQPMICSEFVYRCYDEALPESGDVYTLAIDLATPRGVARGPTLVERGRGRGIESGSILSMAASSPVRARSRGAAAVPVEESLEALAAEYLQQATTVGSSERLTSGAVVEIAPSIDAFAEALHASGTMAGAKEPVRGSRELASPLEELTRAAADFVTPGDLLKTTSLFELEDVKP